MNDRGRVPFALVGVLLLIASTTLSASMVPRAAPATEPAVERAVERGTALTQTAVRSAVREAAREAALDPVVIRANTTTGRQLSPDRPFRDALRLRIYLQTRERLSLLDERVEDVRVRVRLPAPEERQLGEAIRRVHLSPAGPNDTALAVRVENVTVEVVRGGRVLERERVSPALQIRTPVLAVHRRAERFAARIDRGPLSPGLGRRLTAQLYPIVWARGYAQHYGAPIANVLANRHVALATNRGLVAAQRTTLGRSDPDARRGVAAAAARLARRDLLAGASESARSSWAQTILSAAEAEATAAEPTVPGSDAPSPETGTRVGVNLTADRAFADLVQVGGGGNLSSVLGAVYGADVRLTSSIYRTSVSREQADRPSGWTLVDERTETTHRVEPGTGPTPPAPGDWHHLSTYTRVVHAREETVRRWRRGNRTRTTRSWTTRTYRVGVAVVGRHARSAHAPPRPIETVHERGAGPLSGPNLAGVADAAVTRVVDGRGGPDALARRAVAGTLDGDVVRIDGDRPHDLREWIARDLATLRERVRNLSVTVPRGDVGTYEANPPAALADRLAERREALLGAPPAYGSVAGKARLAARAAYLDRVGTALDRRAAGRRDRARRLDDVLREAGVGSLPRLRRVVAARRNVSTRQSDGLRLGVDVDPAYLTLAAVDREQYGTGPGRVHPLVARNLNVFTAPYGDAADQVAGPVADPRRVELRTAARTLRAATAVEAEVGSEEARALTARRASLDDAVGRSGDRVRDRIEAALARSGVGTTGVDRRAIVRTALERWPTRAARSLAIANGSASRAVVEVAARREGLDDHRRDELGVRVRLAAARALRTTAVRPRQTVVNQTVAAARRTAIAALREGAARATDRAAERVRRRALGRSLGAVPAGLPVAPVPGYWYATINVWHVTVRGRYERVVLRAPRGPPGETLAYVRDGDAVDLDVDGDGREERLGRAAHVSFATGTTVVVAVPPSGAGVGDTDGDADERSPGWPHPGPTE